MSSHGAEAPNSSAIPLVKDIFGVSADFLGQLRTWLEQNPPLIPESSVIGRSSSALTITQFQAVVPSAGQEVLVDVDSANGVVWRLKYFADSPLTYKWVKTGGAPIFKRYDSTEGGSAGSGVWTSYTNGPSVTVDQKGIYQADFGGHGLGNAAATESFTGLSIASVDPTVYISHSNSSPCNGATSQQITISSNSSLVKLMHQDTDATRRISVNFRWFKLDPLAISQ